jgi:hypothetical protein
VSDKSNSVGVFGTMIIPPWVATRDGHFTFIGKCTRNYFISASSQAGPCLLVLQLEAWRSVSWAMAIPWRRNRRGRCTTELTSPASGQETASCAEIAAGREQLSERALVSAHRIVLLDAAAGRNSTAGGCQVDTKDCPQGAPRSPFVAWANRRTGNCVLCLHSRGKESAVAYMLSSRCY